MQMHKMFLHSIRFPPHPHLWWNFRPSLSLRGEGQGEGATSDQKRMSLY